MDMWTLTRFSSSLSFPIDISIFYVVVGKMLEDFFRLIWWALPVHKRTYGCVLSLCIDLSCYFQTNDEIKLRTNGHFHDLKKEERKTKCDNGNHDQSFIAPCISRSLSPRDSLRKTLLDAYHRRVLYVDHENSTAFSRTGWANRRNARPVQLLLCSSRPLIMWRRLVTGRRLDKGPTTRQIGGYDRENVTSPLFTGFVRARVTCLVCRARCRC